MEEEEGGKCRTAGRDVGDCGVGGQGDVVVGGWVGQGCCGSHFVFLLLMNSEQFGCDCCWKHQRMFKYLHSYV